MKMIFIKALFAFTFAFSISVCGQNSSPAKANSSGWKTIFTDDFEGGLSSSKWNVKVQQGAVDARWGIVTISGNHAVWCAAAGSAASSLGYGYRNNMNTWITAGPFDLSDASEAKVDFSYWLNCEQDFDYLWCAASEDNNKYLGISYSDSSYSADFKSYSFDLKNYIGKTNVYFGFMFISDSLISDYGGAIIDNVALKKFVYPSKINISNTFTFGDPTQSSGYRLIGLPGVPALSISTTIPGQSKKDWRAFIDNGATSNYLTEFDGSDNFNFVQGRAFWVLSKTAFTINTQVPAAAYASDYTVDVPLHSGWNIIASPLADAVLWEAVKQANSLQSNQVIYGFAGQWATQPIMQPYSGYYFLNSSGLSKLKIPLIPASGKAVYAQPDTAGCIRLAILKSGKEISKAFAGINKNAKEGYDIMDYAAPPSDFEDVRITLGGDGIQDRDSCYFIERRPASGGAALFNIGIKNTSDENAVLKVSVPAECGTPLYLLAKNYTLLQELNENSCYTIKAKSGASVFRLLAGAYSTADSMAKAHSPAAFALSQNYPNPFNSASVIKYSIAKPGVYELSIFNALGEKVSELFSRHLDSGSYSASFDGANLSSGIYFYRLSGEGKVISRKMILLK